LMIQRIGWLF